MSEFSLWQWLIVVALLYLFIRPLVSGFRAGLKSEKGSDLSRRGAGPFVPEVVGESNFRPMVIQSAWIITRWQLVALLALSLWPLLMSFLIPSKPIVAILPVILFASIGWMAGLSLASLFGGSDLAYQIGFSIGVFLIAYLCLVNWRYVRAKRLV